MGNKLNIDLEGKYVILDKKYFPVLKNDVECLFYCKDGFGCSPATMGSAIFGHFCIDAEECRINGSQVKRLATPEEIAQAKFPQPLTEKEKLQGKIMLCRREIARLEKEIADDEKRLKELGEN